MKTLWTLAREALDAIVTLVLPERREYFLAEGPDGIGYVAVPLPTSTEYDEGIRRIYADEV